MASCCLALAHCGKIPGGVDPKYGVSVSPRVVQLGEPVPKGGGVYRVGKPYVVGDRTYSPEQPSRYSAEGVASWYGEDFHGRMTANGEVYDMTAISAAHPTLPIPSYVRVTNLANKRSIIVRVNDRGPFHKNRLIDVSVRTAKLLGFYDQGVARVRVDYVGPASLEGSDDRKLEATLRRGTPAPGPAEVQVASSGPSPSYVPKPAPRSATTREPIGSDTNVAPASRASDATRQVAANEPAASFNSRFAPVAAMPMTGGRIEPISAYAATRSSNGAVITGRGLY